jgi:NADH:ubiquinone oxidoreductase subunit F (NADH-binding)
VNKKDQISGVDFRLLPADGRPVASLEAYRAAGGLKGLEKATGMAPERVIATVQQSGLRGRGGAGFPAGVKWETVRNDPSSTKFVCCNGAEGEPGTFKDRYLILKNPYQLLEGVAIAAHAVGAQRAFVGTKEKFKPQVARLRAAIAEMEEAKVVPVGFITLALGPDEYLFGEEKALLEVVQGNNALPRILPPFVQGLFFTPLEANPTVVNNVETLSNVPHILAHGPEWLRSIGTEDTPGTMVFTVCGDVVRPGMYELPMGTTLRELLYTHAKGPRDGREFKAVFSGVANPVITPDMFDTPMDFGAMRKAGSGLGSGGFIVYDDTACMVSVAAMFAEFMFVESCGQCVPCKVGNDFVAGRLRKIDAGHGDERDIEAVENRCLIITDQTRCYLPAETALLVTSVLQKFAPEFHGHFNGHCCWYPRRPELPKLETYDEQTHTFTYSPPAVEDAVSMRRAAL